MNPFEAIAKWFEQWTDALPFLEPLTDPKMVMFVAIGLFVALAYYFGGGWLGRGGDRRNRYGHDDYEDGYEDGRRDADRDW